MPVDNAMYDRLSDTWWQDDGFLNILKSALNSARFGYMRRILLDELDVAVEGAPTLDVGCGGGLLAEEFARLGCRVTGIDPSARSLAVAREHAAASGLDIDYVQGAGEKLPFEDGSYRIAYCCDVLEHVDSLDRTVAEIARVLAPDGVFLYDTINRTRRSRLVMIKLFQEWRWTACMEPNLHDWSMFIKPDELEATARRHDLDVRGRVGIAPANPLAVVRALRARVRGDIGYGDLGRRMNMQESRDQSGLYAGYAIKLR
jgi:2-polyprenyl-6-hydroxyphenyl methylase/3-demethylubiquinone-9 3-methyltransferase